MNKEALNALSRRPRRSRALRRAITRLSVLAFGLTLPVLFLPGAGRADPQLPAFSGSANALGVQVTVTIPGAPVTTTPIDSGGPTAQAVLDSLGSSTGYAAFPDPGQFVVSIPALAAGLLSISAGIRLPVSPPPYPFFVSSDAATSPDGSAGSGPYQLAAHSSPTTSSASATAGLQSDLFGSAGLVISTSSVVPSAGSVVARATASVQGLTIGPLAFGEIKSTATETIAADGTVTPATDLQIAGMKIAGLSVAVTPAGLAVPGAAIPIPVNKTLAQVLTGSNITVEIVQPKSSPGTVVAPALRITLPVKVSGVSTANGLMSVLIGSTSASMHGASSATSVTPIPALPAVTALGSGADGGSMSASNSSNSPLVSADAQSAPIPSSVSDQSGLARPTPISPTLAQAGVIPLFNIRSLYLIVAAGAFLVACLGHLIRHLGVRTSWTSSDT